MRGARVVQAVLDELADADLAVHVVWLPVMRGDDRDAALAARRHLSDPRARHYWDADRSLGLAYQPLVRLPEGNDTLAWDVYFVHAPGARWDDGPPAPDGWRHQLGLDERSLGDGSGLREDLEAVLGRR